MELGWDPNIELAGKVAERLNTVLSTDIEIGLERRPTFFLQSINARCVKIGPAAEAYEFPPTAFCPSMSITLFMMVSPHSIRAIF
mgnify:CR=1 FL=1